MFSSTTATLRTHASRATRSFSTTSTALKLYPSTSLSEITSRLEASSSSSSSTSPLLVDFHATWCQPCKLLAPTLSKIAEGDEKKVDLIKVDVDEFPQLAQQYGVRAMPTVVLVKDGKAVDQFVGVQPERAILAFLEKNK